MGGAVVDCWAGEIFGGVSWAGVSCWIEGAGKASVEWIVVSFCV
ncbi:hypothetical protein Tco_1152000, partial [Tanacetum coccineum]